MTSEQAKPECTKELIATDCMEYQVFCAAKNQSDYIGITCNCDGCKRICKETSNLETCPFCGNKLTEVEEE